MKRLITLLFLVAFPAFAGPTVAYLGNSKGSWKNTVTNAAGELAGYLGKVIGAPVPTTPWGEATDDVSFLITAAPYVSSELSLPLVGLKKDSFLIKYPQQYQGRTVCLLLAKDDYGYDYPVYYFLRHFAGVEWVGPGELGEVIPGNPNWHMPDAIDVLEEPDFDMRLWADTKFKMARPLMAGSSRMDFHHAFGRIYDPKKYAKTDPDIYALIDGERRVPNPDEADHLTSGWQPCLGNPKVQQIAVDHVLKGFAENPQLTSISLSVNDGGGNHCECELCRAMDPPGALADPLHANYSDRYYRFYNLVIERVLQRNPDAYVAVLGYGPCASPPQQTRINDHVIVFTSVGADPAQYAKAGAKSSVYQYHLDNAYMTIRHYPHLIAEFLRASHAANAVGYYAQIEHSWAAGGAKTFVLAHLLWDVEADVEALQDRYMTLAFGPGAAAAMRAYFDRWEEIFNRESRATAFATIDGWNSSQLPKMQHYTWEDIHFFDAATAIAERAVKTPPQQQRLALVSTYYRWLRANARQYLFARDLGNARWVRARGADEVLAGAESALQSSTEFDRIWTESIAADRSGWLLNPKMFEVVEQGRRFYDSLMVEPIRQAVEAYLADGIQSALQLVSEAAGNGAAGYWQTQLAEHPQLATFIGPELDRLRGVKRVNLLVNGDFEAGEVVSGEPPKLPGWWFYDRVGMVTGATAEYLWEPRRADSKCLGFGPGKYPGIRAFVELEPGRYAFSFRYQTIDREAPVTVNIMQLVDSVQLSALRTVEQVRAMSAVNSNFIKFLLNNYPPTGGEWQQIRTSFQVEQRSCYGVFIEPFYMAAGSWVWFDDVELVQLTAAGDR